MFHHFPKALGICAECKNETCEVDLKQLAHDWIRPAGCWQSHLSATVHRTSLAGPADLLFESQGGTRKGLSKCEAGWRRTPRNDDDAQDCADHNGSNCDGDDDDDDDDDDDGDVDDDVDDGGDENDRGDAMAMAAGLLDMIAVMMMRQQ